MSLPALSTSCLLENPFSPKEKIENIGLKYIKALHSNCNTYTSWWVMPPDCAFAISMCYLSIAGGAQAYRAARGFCMPVCWLSYCFFRPAMVFCTEALKLLLRNIALLSFLKTVSATTFFKPVFSVHKIFFFSIHACYTQYACMS